jgi:ComF family protein
MSILNPARVGRFLLDSIYPPVCALCSRPGAFLCAGCEATLPLAKGDRCSACWLPLFEAHCQPPHAFAALRSRYRYTAEVQKLVHKLKFSRQSSLAEPLGALLADSIVEFGGTADALVPVPLRTMRERDRGYNQALLLARRAGKLLQVPVLEALQRSGDAGAQAQAETAEQRRANVAGAFRLRHGTSVADLSLMLVDDVATTGATLDACARELIAAGAASVSAITLARED